MNLSTIAFLVLSAALSLVEIATAQPEAKPSRHPVQNASKNPFDTFQTFSAILNGGVGEDHDRKIYRSGNLMRLDFGDSYRITDLARNMTWGVDPHSCAQIAMPDAGTFPFSAYRDFSVERSLITEKDIVDGHICVVENITFTPPDNRPFVIQMKVWEAEDLERFPIRIEVEPRGPMAKAESKLVLTYTDVSLAPPAPTLFKHPAKCARAAQPGKKP